MLESAYKFWNNNRGISGFNMRHLTVKVVIICMKI